MLIIVIFYYIIGRRNAYHSIVHLKFEETDPIKYVDMGYEPEQQILTDRVEFHYIELPKFLKQNPGISNELEQWLWLIIGEEDKVKMASEKNKSIEKVVEDLDEMSADENERLEAYKRKLAIWDYNVSINEATDNGKKEGKKEEKLEIAKNLKKQGIEIEIIIKATGLSREEVESLN